MWECKGTRPKEQLTIEILENLKVSDTEFTL